MTFQEVCQFFEDRGYVSFTNSLRSHAVHYALPQHIESLKGPDCDCNKKPIPFHVVIFRPEKSYDILGSITFESFGECQGQWTKLEIYSISYDQLNDDLVNKAKEGLSNMWIGFCKAFESAQ